MKTTEEAQMHQGTRRLMAWAIVSGQTYTDETGRVWTPDEAAKQVGLTITEDDMEWARVRADAMAFADSYPDA